MKSKSEKAIEIEAADTRPVTTLLYVADTQQTCQAIANLYPKHIQVHRTKYETLNESTRKEWLRQKNAASRQVAASQNRSHACKSHVLVRGSRAVWALTIRGAPLTNSLEDFFSQFGFKWVEAKSSTAKPKDMPLVIPALFPPTRGTHLANLPVFERALWDEYLDCVPVHPRETKCFKLELDRRSPSLSFVVSKSADLATADHILASRKLEIAPRVDYAELFMSMEELDRRRHETHEQFIRSEEAKRLGKPNTMAVTMASFESVGVRAWVPFLVDLEQESQGRPVSPIVKSETLPQSERDTLIGETSDLEKILLKWWIQQDLDQCTPMKLAVVHHEMKQVYESFFDKDYGHVEWHNVTSFTPLPLLPISVAGKTLLVKTNSPAHAHSLGVTDQVLSKLWFNVLSGTRQDLEQVSFRTRRDNVPTWFYERYRHEYDEAQAKMEQRFNESKPSLGECLIAKIRQQFHSDWSHIGSTRLCLELFSKKTSHQYTDLERKDFVLYMLSFMLLYVRIASQCDASSAPVTQMERTHKHRLCRADVFGPKTRTERFRIGQLPARLEMFRFKPKTVSPESKSEATQVDVTVPNGSAKTLSIVAEEESKKTNSSMAPVASGLQEEYRFMGMRSLYEAITSMQPGSRDQAQLQKWYTQYLQKCSAVRGLQISELFVQPETFQLVQALTSVFHVCCMNKPSCECRLLYVWEVVWIVSFSLFQKHSFELVQARLRTLVECRRQDKTGTGETQSSRVEEKAMTETDQPVSANDMPLVQNSLVDNPLLNPISNSTTPIHDPTANGSAPARNEGAKSTEPLTENQPMTGSDLIHARHYVSDHLDAIERDFKSARELITGLSIQHKLAKTIVQLERKRMIVLSLSSWCEWYVAQLRSKTPGPSTCALPDDFLADKHSYLVSKKSETVPSTLTDESSLVPKPKTSPVPGFTVQLYEFDHSFDFK